MSALREAAQQAVEALELITDLTNHDDEIYEAIAALRAALAQPDDWTRCHHCGQTMPPVPLGQAESLTGLDMFLDPQDELKPKRYKPKAEPAQEPYTGDVTRIMREAGMTFHLGLPHKAVVEQMTRVIDLVYAEASIKAAQQFASALAQKQAEPDLSRCPQCNGPADNGHDRSIPPSPYLCTKCMAEPAQEPVTTLGYAARKIVELIAQRDALLETLKYIAKQFRQHGRQHWPEAVAARLAIEAVEGEKK